MKFVSRLSVAALAVVAVGSGLMSMTNAAIAAPAPGSWDQSIQGEGIAVAGQFSIKINTDVWSDVNGTAFGSMSYEKSDGFRMYANVECAKTFKQGTVATLAGPIAKKVGVGGQGDDGNWMYYEINNTGGIRVLTFSKEAALKYCNQPTGEFPGTFTSGGVTIKLNRQIRPIPKPFPGLR
jgi:hypothetical protein